ncbi:hypothetical protein LTR36_001931 [Oleoguttula mirabilis]|uniref:Uncharacterized protein n=1 Tax=Oleoguttula mirabilis TaxID=1507867 RepID=A0AAV9JLX3_9PEZI|nr:hypothetical protein LTR36_001931 [Oleoguttula mirabilis]
MAEASSSRDQPETRDETIGPSTGRSESHRNSYYDQQRTGRTSRPVSGSSKTTSRSKGKRASHQQRYQEPQDDQEPYQEPQDFENLDEVSIAEPTGPQRRSSLEETRSRHAGSSGGDQEGQKEYQFLSEETAEPPVESSEPPRSSNSVQKRRVRDDPNDDDADTESMSAPPPFVQRRPEDYLPRRKTVPQVPSWLSELYTISYLIFFSILGTLARLGIQWLTFYPGAPIVTPVIWANFAGSVFMGFLSEDQRLFRDGVSLEPNEKRSDEGHQQSDVEKLSKDEVMKRKKQIPLYIGLAVGFCGSFTSFSSFARDAFLGLSNTLPTPVNHPNAFDAGTVSDSSTVGRNGGYSFEAWAAIVIMTLTLCMGGLIVGAQAALFLQPFTPRLPIRLARRVLDPLGVVLGFGCWLGAVFMCIWPPDRPGGPSSRGSWADETWRGQVLFALVFAPLGCLLRFYASLKLNGIAPTFPLGTFAVNMLGTAIEGMCYDVQHVGVGIMGRIGGGRVGCQVLQGVQDGFCGCLTTISTWVAEINGLQRKHGWAYAFASVMGALGLMVVIMGSVRWSVGYATPACNTGYPDKIHG